VPAGRGRGGEQGRARETDYRTISVHRHERPTLPVVRAGDAQARLIRRLVPAISIIGHYAMLIEIAVTSPANDAMGFAPVTLEHDPEKLLT